jgi:hypothetical protein
VQPRLIILCLSAWRKKELIRGVACFFPQILFYFQLNLFIRRVGVSQICACLREDACLSIRAEYIELAHHWIRWLKRRSIGEANFSGCPSRPAIGASEPWRGAQAQRRQRPKPGSASPSPSWSQTRVAGGRVRAGRQGNTVSEHGHQGNRRFITNS